MLLRLTYSTENSYLYTFMSTPDVNNLSLRLYLSGNCKIYWDGNLIVKCGSDLYLISYILYVVVNQF